jgi:hypothetical protein
LLPGPVGPWRSLKEAPMWPPEEPKKWVWKGPRRAEEVPFGVLEEIRNKRLQRNFEEGARLSASQPQGGPKKGHRRAEEGAVSVLEKEGRRNQRNVAPRKAPGGLGRGSNGAQ